MTEPGAGAGPRYKYQESLQVFAEWTNGQGKQVAGSQRTHIVAWLDVDNNVNMMKYLLVRMSKK